MDGLGHINNAKYFTYDEQARIDYFERRLAEIPGDRLRSSFILAHIGCDFIEQMHHPSAIDYGMRITRIGRSSLHTEGAAFVGARCHSRTQGVIVWFDYAAQKVLPIPDTVRRGISDFEVVPPEQ